MKFQVGDEVYFDRWKQIGKVVSINNVSIYGPAYPILVIFTKDLDVSFTSEGFQIEGDPENRIRKLTKLDKALR